MSEANRQGATQHRTITLEDRARAAAKQARQLHPRLHLTQGQAKRLLDQKATGRRQSR